VLSSQAFVMRWFADDPRLEVWPPSSDGDRLLVVNLGADLRFNPAPEPLLAPQADRGWSLLWSSEDPKYGGQGTAPLDTDDNWLIPGQATVLLSSDR
jgi:maltooligosyltrehalose trehalohydrolase